MNEWRHIEWLHEWMSNLNNARSIDWVSEWMNERMNDLSNEWHGWQSKYKIIHIDWTSTSQKSVRNRASYSTMDYRHHRHHHHHHHVVPSTLQRPSGVDLRPLWRTISWWRHRLLYRPMTSSSSFNHGLGRYDVTVVSAGHSASLASMTGEFGFLSCDWFVSLFVLVVSPFCCCCWCCCFLCGYKTPLYKTPLISMEAIKESSFVVVPSPATARNKRQF